jgi:hypothetical protein
MLMYEFFNAGATKVELSSLNRCRMHLKAYFLSVITNGFGTIISNDAWMGRYHDIPWHMSWPKQAPPMQHDWTVWRHFIR